MKFLYFAVLVFFIATCFCINIYLYLESSKLENDHIQISEQNKFLPQLVDQESSSSVSQSELITYTIPQKNLQKDDFFFKERHQTPNFTSKSKCIPFSYGIYPEEDPTYLITKSFTCETVPKMFTIENEIISLNCSNDAYLYIPSSNITDHIGGEVPEKKWTYSKSNDLHNTEFVFAKCGFYTAAILRNIHKPSAALRASKISKALQKENNSKPRTLSFIYLIIDSLSRQSIFRHLKSTIQYLKTELNSKYALYDFLLNTCEGPTTVPNISLLYLGQYIEYIKKNIGEHDDVNAQLGFVNLQNKSALWKEFERNGFVTMFNTESYTDFVSQATGRKILTDHVVGDFWKVAGVYTRFKEFITGPQCIGGKMPHDYSLKYTKEFLKNYSENNRAAFFSLNTAHEDNGSRLKTLDKPLNEFLHWVLTENQSDETVLVIAGDHGRYFSPLTLDSYTEKIMPGHLIVMSKSLINRLGMHASLKYNQDKLLHRLDWYETLKFLPKLMYKEFPPTQKEIYDFKSSLPHPRKNIFFEKIEQNRTCASLKVSHDFCFCHSEIVNSLKPNKEIEDIVNQAMNLISQYISTNRLETLCQQPLNWTIYQMDLVSQEKISDLKIHINITFPQTSSTLIIAAYQSDPTFLQKSHNNNRILLTRTPILSALNDLHLTKYKFYNLFLLEPVPELKLSNELVYLCKPHNSSN